MKIIFLFSLILCFVLFSFKKGVYDKYHLQLNAGWDYSTNPPASRTGAPGETDCTQCHSGSAQSAFGIVNYTYSGVDQKYVEGQTYNITIGTISGNKNGFEMVILDGNDENAGSFDPGTNTDVITANSRKYIRHSVSSGVNSWSFNWTAPAVDVGDLTVYYTYNKSNNDGLSSGDPIYIGQQVIYSSYVVGLSEYDEIDSDYSVNFDNNSKTLRLSYITKTKELIIVQVRDVTGRLILNENLGKKHGKHEVEIALNQTVHSGIHIVSLFIGNKVFNRKLYINN